MSGMSGGGSVIISGNTGSVMGHYLSLVGSGGISVAGSGTTLTISGSSSSGVSSLNSLTGALSITGGNNITITPSGSNIAVAVTGNTQHAVTIGDSAGQLKSLAVGLNGQTIMGSTAADPGWTSSPQFGGSVTATNDVTSTAGSISSLAGSIITRDATNTATGPNEYFQKSRVANPITSGDSLGVQRFTGYDGTGFITGAKITSTNSGTVATNRVAGNLQFYTHPDSVIALPSEPLLRMTIDSTGAITAPIVYSTTVGVTAGVGMVDSTGLLGTLSGTAGQILQGGTKPAFSTATYPSTVAAGDVLVASATNVIGVANGNANPGYVLTSNATGAPTFQAGGSGGGIGTLDGDSGTATGATVTIAGTSNQITTTGNNSATVTLSVPSTFTSPGSVTATTNFNLPKTTSTAGIIYQNNLAGSATPFIHSYDIRGISGNGYNTFVGFNTGNFTLTSAANFNTVIGATSMQVLTSGNSNSSFGVNGLNSCTSGSNNTVCGGTNGLANLTTGSYNTAIGSPADGYWNGSGANYTGSESYNVLVANLGVVGESNVMRLGRPFATPIGINKTYIAAIHGVTPGGSDVQTVIIDANGQLGSTSSGGAVSSVSGTTNQIAVSPTTGATVVSLVTSPTVSGNWVTTAGNLSLPTTTSTAGQITINGDRVFHMYGGNLFIGDNAGNFTINAASGYNTAIGSGSLINIAGDSSGNGSSNCAYGYYSGLILTDGNYNCFFGALSNGGPHGVTTGNFNTFLGAMTGGLPYVSSESSNILIGFNVTGGAAGESNCLRIGNGTGTEDGNLSTAYICGITGITVTGTAVLVATNNQLGVAVSSKKYKKDIQDMPNMTEVISKLRPVTFHYKDEKQSAQLNYGLIAEEVEQVWPEMVAYDKDGEISTLYYQFLAPVLLKEIQNLRKEIEALKLKLEGK